MLTFVFLPTPWEGVYCKRQCADCHYISWCQLTAFGARVTRIFSVFRCIRGSKMVSSTRTWPKYLLSWILYSFVRDWKVLLWKVRIDMRRKRKKNVRTWSWSLVSVIWEVAKSSSPETVTETENENWYMKCISCGLHAFFSGMSSGSLRNWE